MSKPAFPNPLVLLVLGYTNCERLTGNESKVTLISCGFTLLKSIVVSPSREVDGRAKVLVEPLIV